MLIPSQLPQIVTPARAGALQALALHVGQVLDGRVIGAAPNGGTQVEIRGQLLNLMLPAAVKAGEVLKFEVQGAGQQLHLAMRPGSTAAAQAQSPPPAAQPPPAALPSITSPGPVPPPAVTIAASAGSAPPAPAVPPSASPPSAPSSPLAATPPSSYPQPSAQSLLAAATLAPGTPASPAAAGHPAIAPVAPVAAGTPAGSATANPLPSGPATPATTPQAALAQMVHASVPRQGSAINLTTALARIAGQVVLPEPVVRAAQQVLARRTAIDATRFDGPALQSAIRASGVFQEARLAQGQLPLPQADMKSALRQTLINWLGPQAPVAAVTPMPPPLKGSIPRARAGEAPPIDPKAAPEEVGRHLLERTETALARVRLHQHASLPDAPARPADWSMDLPVMVGTHQTLLHLQIHGDQHGEGEAAADRGWQMRFAINLPGLGEVGAQVSLRGGATGVMLWAAEAQTSAALEAGTPMLREMLVGAGLVPGAIVVRHGEPPAPTTMSSAGHFLDAST